MVGPVAFLMKDVVLLAVSVYLLKEDVARVAAHAERPTQETTLSAGYHL
jgi:uncharacterized membrane protein YkgB